MNSTIKIGIIGDYDGRVSHTATDEAARHCAAQLGLELQTQWLPTDSLLEELDQNLNGFDGFWCAPGSPYKSAQGAMNGIQFARENNYPFIGTCGGFQHAVLEFARDILKLSEVGSAEFDPYAPNLFITGLNCSLIGETKKIIICRNSKVYKIYGKDETEEKYNCNFGLNSQFQNQMTEHGFIVAGTDENQEARILELPQNHFFVATLFQPQLSSTPANPHKLILAYLESVNEFHLRRSF